MMSAWYESARKYGRDMVLYTADEPEGVEIRGFIKALDLADAEKLRRAGHLGENDVGRYLYIGPPSPAVGEAASAFLDCGGERFAFKSARARVLGTQVSHWEGILKCLGEAENA